MTIAFLTSVILSLSPIFRYAVLFFLVAVEGPLVTMAAGFFGSIGLLNLFVAYFVIVIADLFSDIVYYGIGYWGGKTVETKYANFTKLTSRRLHRLQYLFQKHPKKTVMVGKISHFIGVPVLVGAGLSRLSFRTFVLYDGIATLPKTLVFLLIGYYFKRTSEFFNIYLRYGTFTVTGLVILFFLLYILIGVYFDRNLMK